MLKDLPDAVLWDMDGTLIDQTASILRCYGEVLSQMGYAVPSDYTIKRSLGGPLASTLAELLPDEQIDAGGELFRKLFPQYMFEGMKVVGGHSSAHSLTNGPKLRQIFLSEKAAITATHQYAARTIAHGACHWSTRPHRQPRSEWIRQ